MKPHYLIFGATGALGGAVARRLAGPDTALSVSGRDHEKLQLLARELSALPLQADAVDWDAVTQVVAEAKRSRGRLDGVVACVGSLLLKPAHTTSRDEFDDLIAANLTAPFGILRAAARAMLGSGGSIVLVSSVAARLGMANHEAIATAKAGLEGLTRSAAASYANRAVRVNCVAPAVMDTPLSARLLASSDARTTTEKRHPLGRIGTVSDAASAIAWLLAPEQGWITGQVLGVDGGMGSCLPKQ